MKSFYKKFWFTLVELIIVVTILVILWTIAFISLQSYAKSARESARNADINRLKYGLEIFFSEFGFYPKPDNWVNIMYSWAIAWIQGTVWSWVLMNLQKLNKTPVDPYTLNEYTYSVAKNSNKYELWYISEYNSKQNAIAKISWNYNWFSLKVSTWWVTYILAIPSIISTEIDNIDLIDIIKDKKLVFNDYLNLPSSYKGKINDMFWWFDYDPSKLIIYNWSLFDLKSDPILQKNALENLKLAIVELF